MSEVAKFTVAVVRESLPFIVVKYRDELLQVLTGATLSHPRISCKPSRYKTSKGLTSRWCSISPCQASNQKMNPMKWLGEFSYCHIATLADPAMTSRMHFLLFWSCACCSRLITIPSQHWFWHSRSSIASSEPASLSCSQWSWCVFMFLLLIIILSAPSTRTPGNESWSCLHALCEIQPTKYLDCSTEHRSD